jgi:hypothetical protein
MKKKTLPGPSKNETFEHEETPEMVYKNCNQLR